MATKTKKFKLRSTPRAGLIAPRGYSIGSVDFSAQEAMIAAYFSRDPMLLEIFNAPMKLETGEKNPKADIHCFSEDTRVYVRSRGWQTFDNVSIGEEIIAYDPQKRETQWECIQEVVWEDYSGKLIRIQGRKVDQLVTPNHRVLLESACTSFSQPFTVSRADKIIQYLNLFQYNQIPYVDNTFTPCLDLNPAPLQVSVERYQGKVGCVSVPSGFVVIQHNNRTSVSGNTINAMNCTHPWLFKGVPPERQVAVAKDASLIPEKGCARDYAKILLYGVQYLQGADGMANLHHIPLETAKFWIQQHEVTFPYYHKWVAEQKHLAEVRGWAMTPLGHCRLVNEDNAKAAGSSPGRSGVNHLVQGLGAEMSKSSLIRAFQTLNMEKVQLINAVHDKLKRRVYCRGL